MVNGNYYKSKCIRGSCHSSIYLSLTGSIGTYSFSLWFFTFSFHHDDLTKVTEDAQIFAWPTIYIICHMKVMHSSLKCSLADSYCIPQSACTWTTSIHIRVFLSQHTLSKLLWSLILLTLQCSRILSPNPLFSLMSHVWFWLLSLLNSFFLFPFSFFLIL